MTNVALAMVVVTGANKRNTHRALVLCDEMTSQIDFGGSGRNSPSEAASITNTASHVEKSQLREVHGEDQQIISHGPSDNPIGSFRTEQAVLILQAVAVWQRCAHTVPPNKNHAEQESISLMSVRTFWFSTYET